jgi:hypothetical protein
MDLLCSQCSTIGFRDILGEIAFNGDVAPFLFLAERLGASQLVDGHFQSAMCFIECMWSLLAISA